MNNNIFKIIPIIIVNLILLAIIGIWGYNKFIKVTPYVISTEQYRFSTSPEICNIYPDKGTYVHLVPNTSCKGTISKNDKIIKKTTQNIDTEGFRKTPEVYNKNKKSIVIFGCSFPFGFGLDDNETFPWLLSEQTHKKVYNAALNGGSAQQMLLNLQSDYFYKKVKNPDTFIYLTGYDHLHRLYGPPYEKATNFYYPIFKLKNNKLIYIPEPLAYKIGGYISSIANYQAYRKKVTTNVESDETIKLYIALLKESQKLIKKHYPESRFIVFIFDNNDMIYKAVKDNGFEVVKLESFFNEQDIDNKYMTIQYHPTAEFWQKITPLFIKKVNL